VRLEVVQVAKLFSALLLLALLGGCGYHTVVARDPISGANGVNVIVFANKTYRPGVPALLARNLVDELALRTGGRVLPGDQAQLELTGAVLSYVSSAVSYTAADQIREYRLSVKVEAVLRERQTRKVLWKGELAEEQVYPVNANLALQLNAEEAAVDKICRRLSEDIWQKIGERF
jgi:outer membrane lipopolysaccharide assembly protein LptE/RlpB